MLRPGQVVILCVVALLAVGVIMVNSAVMTVDPVHAAGPPGADDGGFCSILRSVVLSRWTAYAALALVAMGAASMVPVRQLTAWVGQPADSGHHESRSGSAGRSQWRVLGLGVAGLLLLLSMAYWPGLGREVNGAHRWFFVPVPGVGHVSVQPSEIAKWGLVGLIAWYAAARGPVRMAHFWQGLAPGLLAAALVAGAVAHEDLGTGVLIGFTACLVLLAAGAKLWQFLMFTPAAAAGFAVLVATNPYRIERLATFLDPYRDPLGSGYHMIQSMAAVAGGEVTGRGLGHGLQKFGYLVEDHTDFLFAVICEELGVAGAAAVVGVFALLIWAGLSIVRREQAPMLKLAGLGVLVTIGLQALINLAVVTGMAPTKGIALPLVSAGGTGWILTAASLGLLVAMDRAAREDEPSSEPAVSEDLAVPIAG
jgi:cell division protein FtsW